MDSEAARKAFDASRAGKRVGVLASPKAEISGQLQKLYSNLTMDERKDIQLYRSFEAITVEWPNGGILKVMGRPSSFRGLTFDIVFIPEDSNREVRRVLVPTVMITNGSIGEY